LIRKVGIRRPAPSEGGGRFLFYPGALWSV
jgi:hypothetical protein